MLPITLTIEGLYSYQERQTIDFEHLTQAGIFGIFGAVGSGKSSILEAITFALYGETERLNSRDKRAYNMMNLKSNRSFIEFEFYNFENEKFRVIREFKRHSKNFENITTISGRFFHWHNEQWLPIEKNAEEILGISYTNFKRTIIIPQGQFKEFIELGAKDRTEMMKEIFNLNKFDLAENTKSLTLKNQSQLDQVEGQLKGFEDINTEKIQEQNNLLKEEAEDFSKINADFLRISEEFQHLKKLKTDWQNLKTKKLEYHHLESQHPQILEQQKEAEEFEMLNKIFAPLLLEKNKIEKDLSQQKSEQLKVEEKLQQTTQSLQKISTEITEIQPLFDNLNQSKNEEHDIKNIIDILKLSKTIQTTKERTEKGILEIQKVEKNIEELKQKIILSDKKITELKSQKIDNKTILELEHWFTTQKNHLHNQENQREKIRKINSEIIGLENFINEIPLLKNSTDNPTTIFETEKSRLESEKNSLSEEKKHLEVQQKLALLTHTLHHGEACPLCGSLEHPKVIHFQDNTENINQLNQQLSKVEDVLNHLQKSHHHFIITAEKIKSLHEQLTTENKILTEISDTISLHQKAFVWQNFNAENPQDFEAKKQQNFHIEHEINRIEYQKKEYEISLENERKNKEKYQTKIESLKTEEAQKNGEITSLKQQIKILNWEDFLQESPISLQEKLEDVQQKNLHIEKNFHQLSECKTQLSLQFTQQKTTLEFLYKRIQEQEHHGLENENKIKTEIENTRFQNITDIENIISKSINVSEIRKRVQEFNIKIETLKSKIEELELNFEGTQFNEEHFQNTENQFNIKEQERNEKQKIITRLESEIERMERLFKEKKQLLTQLSTLQKRADNLKIMSNLFKGAGFVQYVSTIYLRQLCDHANQRFHRMTRNSLSLHISENNEFEIIDYLNDGRIRSVKTLSGGQAFQVSLSLALALAESVQTNAKADKNFFFIDEGFGTQDVESVNIVFETISNLLKENRIVGIISHIEELKEKIPVSLSIIKSEEKGSRIKYS